MALTRNFLKSIGINEEQIGAIIEAHTETVDALKREKADVQKELDAANEAVKTAKADKDTLQADYDKYKADQAERDTLHSKESAYEALLKEAGIAEKYIKSVKKVAQYGEIELTKDGKIKNAEQLTEQIKNDYSAFISATETPRAQVSTPPNNNSAMTKEQIMAITDRTERRKAIADNLQLFGKG